MEWLGWLIAGGLALAFYNSYTEAQKARAALATVQIEVAKLANLWAGEVIRRRELQDEYDRPTETVQAERTRRYTEAEEPYSLFATSVFESPGEHLFTDRRELLDKVLLESDPVSWGQRLIPRVISFVSKKC